jgi:hypothetical protein
MPQGVGCDPPISRGCLTLRGLGSRRITEQRAPLAVQVPPPSLLALLVQKQNTEDAEEPRSAPACMCRELVDEQRARARA